MKRLVALLALCCCNHSFAWGATDRCSDAYSCSIGGMLIKGAAGKYLDYKEKKLKESIDIQQRKEHDIADTQEKKFQYLKNSAENIVNTNQQGNKIIFSQVVSNYLEISNIQTESEDFKKSLINECFTSETDKEKNGICTFNKYLNTYAKEKEAQRLAAQKQADQEAIKKRAEYKKQLAKGIPKTEYNIRRYCQASANVVVEAYVNAALQAQMGSRSRRFNPENKELLNINPTQEKKLIMIASDDAERAVLLSRDYMLQNTYIDQYSTKCFANPKTMIINYYEIFKN